MNASFRKIRISTMTMSLWGQLVTTPLGIYIRFTDITVFMRKPTLRNISWNFNHALCPMSYPSDRVYSTFYKTVGTEPCKCRGMRLIATGDAYLRGMLTFQLNILDKYTLNSILSVSQTFSMLRSISKRAENKLCKYRSWKKSRVSGYLKQATRDLKDPALRARTTEARSVVGFITSDIT